MAFFKKTTTPECPENSFYTFCLCNLYNEELERKARRQLTWYAWPGITRTDLGYVQHAIRGVYNIRFECWWY